MCYQRRVTVQVLKTVVPYGEKKLVPSCSPIYAKLKKIFGDRKGRKEEQEDQSCTNPMLLLIDLAGNFYFIFTEGQGR